MAGTDRATGARAALLRPREVAALLGCSEWWLKEQARNRRIPFAWIGGSYRFTDEHVAEIIRWCEVRPPNRSPRVSGEPAARTVRVAAARSGADLAARVPRRTRAAQQERSAA